MKGPALCMTARSASSRACRSNVRIISACRRSIKSVPRICANAASRLSPSALAEASKSATTSARASTAPPRRWVYCCAYSGNCEADAPPNSPPIKARLRTITGPPPDTQHAPTRHPAQTSHPNHGTRHRRPKLQPCPPRSQHSCRYSAHPESTARQNAKSYDCHQSVERSCPARNRPHHRYRYAAMQTDRGPRSHPVQNVW
mmetsp:Transcript_23351/g.40716  ORF Transcript_23351/g.40716 Transcript_23351/m.40716 type:complete len:201 (-) Transcript_23351:2022-2624(-)